MKKEKFEHAFKAATKYATKDFSENEILIVMTSSTKTVEELFPMLKPQLDSFLAGVVWAGKRRNRTKK